MDKFQKDDPLQSLDAIATPAQIARLQSECRQIRVSLPVKQYIADIVAATRNSEYLRFGASPRGALGLMRSAQAMSAMRERDFALPDDIKHLVGPVLTHRLVLKDEELLRGETAEHLLEKILDRVPVPDNAA